MRNIPALCAFLLCLPLTAWPQSTPPDAAGREVFTDSASVMCAARAEPALKPGGERMRRLLEALELDAYVSARHGGTGFNQRDLDALLARVERICAAHPERGLAEVWREQKKTWHRGPWKTTMTRSGISWLRAIIMRTPSFSASGFTPMIRPGTAATSGKPCGTYPPERLNWSGRNARTRPTRRFWTCCGACRENDPVYGRFREPLRAGSYRWEWSEPKAAWTGKPSTRRIPGPCGSRR